MITNYVHNPGEVIPEIPELGRRQEFLRECSRSGGMIPDGFPVYRGDTRSLEEIQREGGFIPSTELRPGETLPQHARWQAGEILKLPANMFIHYWKYSDSCPADYRPLIKGAEKRLAGVACGVEGEQKGGGAYEIRLPQLYALTARTDTSHTVCIYGDGTTWDNSTVFWMHLILLGGNAEEIVSLTTVPIGQITKQ